MEKSIQYIKGNETRDIKGNETRVWTEYEQDLLLWVDNRLIGSCQLLDISKPGMLYKDLAHSFPRSDWFEQIQIS
jgi:hypothetical protein